MVKYVYDFVEGSKDLKNLLGGKGANLAEMTRLGLPVPPGFTITTEACRQYLATCDIPDGLFAEVGEHLRAMEMRTGKDLGDPVNPLLVSVRSGGKLWMPGMMDTVLNVGLTDAGVAGLAAHTGDPRYAWDSYRRLIQMFGKTVFGVPGEEFDAALRSAKDAKGITSDTNLGTGDLVDLVEEYKKVFHAHTGRDFPQAPHEQLFLAIRAVFESWNSERAMTYRRHERIPNDPGTAVNVVAMVYGNLGVGSGTGVAFTRDPATGARGGCGDYLENAQGEDVVAGIRDAVALQKLAELDRHSYDELIRIMAKLEAHYQDQCDIEFTIERGKLWMLQTRIGKRTPAAAFVIASQLVDEGVIDIDEALRRVTGKQLTALMFPTFDLSGNPKPTATGVPAFPGAAVGRVVFDSAAAAAATQAVIFVSQETTPDDLPGMIAAQGILTSRGGKTSHAAVVARGMGTTCVCGVEALDIDAERRQFTVGDTVVREGDIISIDGTTGAAYVGAVRIQPSPVVRYFEGTLSPESDVLLAAVHRLLGHADATRRLRVRANANTGVDAAQARRFGAEGIGLCRTEHMFLGERREIVERLILATDDDQRQASLDALLLLHRADFIEILRAMDGQPVTIRLLDPPLHEFLPPLEDLAVRVALAEERGEDPGRDAALLAAVRRIHEANPMLGLRGVRLGLIVPDLFGMQVRAIAEAAATVRAEGGDPRPEIMVPLVGAVQELKASRVEIDRALSSVDGSPRIRVGTMIEVPRAALTAAEIAGAAEFFSFGTDDLIGIAVAEARSARPALTIGVYGEHGGDPDSVHFFHEAVFDYVSCSPYRVPVARLEAGRAALPTTSAASDSR